MGEGAPIVVCRGLAKEYGNVRAVDGLDLTIHQGECFGMLGPNGAGKTTTIEIMEGLTEQSHGEVTLFGMSWRSDAPKIRERLGISLQETHLPELLTVRETVALFRSFFSEGRDIDETVARVALTEKANARYHTLSGGQKQRLAVACAIVGAPDLLFLDEPTTGLDPQSRRLLWDVIAKFREGGGTVVLTTHYMDEAEELCDRVGIVDRGKIIALGTPKELIATHVSPESVRVRDTEGTLEDVFMTLTGRHLRD